MWHEMLLRTPDPHLHLWKGLGMRLIIGTATQHPLSISVWYTVGSLVRRLRRGGEPGNEATLLVHAVAWGNTGFHWMAH